MAVVVAFVVSGSCSSSRFSGDERGDAPQAGSESSGEAGEGQSTGGSAGNGNGGASNGGTNGGTGAGAEGGEAGSGGTDAGASSGGRAGAGGGGGSSGNGGSSGDGGSSGIAGSSGGGGSGALGGMAGAAGTGGSAGADPRPCPADMVNVSGGTFTLGAGAYPDAIELTVASFCMDKTEVTLGRYLECSNGGGCMAPFTGTPCTASLGVPEHPVNCVTPSQARSFCAWAAKRLPTEAEWEYAARGTEQRSYPWGAAGPANNLLNWCGTTDCAGDGFQFTAPVGQFPMGNTPLGISDMAGNLFEVTSSLYCPYSDPDCDTTLIVARGGSWDDSMPTTFRTTYRWYLQEGNFNTFTGFRCAR